MREIFVEVLCTSIYSKILIIKNYMAKHKDKREICTRKIKLKISCEESVAIGSFSHQEGMVRIFTLIPCFVANSPPTV